MQTWVKHNRTLITQNLGSIFQIYPKTSVLLNLGKETYVIRAKETDFKAHQLI